MACWRSFHRAGRSGVIDVPSILVCESGWAAWPFPVDTILEEYSRAGHIVCPRNADFVVRSSGHLFCRSRHTHSFCYAGLGDIVYPCGVSCSGLSSPFRLGFHFNRWFMFKPIIALLQRLC